MINLLPPSPAVGTQALVRPGSPNSSLSADDRISIAPICKVKALVDSTPNPYDTEALRYKVSALIIEYPVLDDFIIFPFMFPLHPPRHTQTQTHSQRYKYRKVILLMLSQ